MIFILFAYDVILQDLVPKEEKNENSIHAHFTSCENEFPVGVPFTRGTTIRGRQMCAS